VPTIALRIAIAPGAQRTTRWRLRGRVSSEQLQGHVCPQARAIRQRHDELPLRFYISGAGERSSIDGFEVEVAQQRRHGRYRGAIVPTIERADLLAGEAMRARRQAGPIA
jgi:hypothetical protein